MSIDLGGTVQSEVRTRRSPYLGLVPYGEEDAPFYFGRERDVRLITANLFAAPLTLLYGASGVGKSSVLRAGLAYQSRARDDLLVVVFNTWQGEPVAALKDALERTYAAVGRPDAADHGESAHDDELPLGEYLVARAGEIGRRLMIVLDQFEEYFLYHSGDEPFGMQFPAAVAQSDRPVSFLVSIREDALAKLDRFEGRIPGLFDNYLRLEHLDRQAAAEAITKPVEQYNRLVAAPGLGVMIEPPLVEAVVDQVGTELERGGEGGQGVFRLAGAPERIDTSYLQVVMTRLWDEERRAGSRTLRLETLQRLGNARDILRTHLDDALGALDPADQEVAAEVFHFIVTPSGTKIAHTADDLASYTGLDRGRIGTVLSHLSQQEIRVLRPLAPPGHHDEPRYEIYHDRLADAVLSWRRRYRTERQLAAERARSQEALDATRAEAERRLAEQRSEAEARLARERVHTRAVTRQGFLLSIAWTFLFWVSFVVAFLVFGLIALYLFFSTFYIAAATLVLIPFLAAGWSVGLAVRARAHALRSRQVWRISLWWIASAVGVVVGAGVLTRILTLPWLTALTIVPSNLQFILPILNLLSLPLIALGAVGGFLGQAYVAGSLTVREVDRAGGFDPPRSEPSLVYADFWRRGVAFVIDYLVVFVGGLVIFFAANAVIPANGAFLTYSTSVASIGTWWLYEAVLTSSGRQATFGKTAVGLVVTDLRGGRISFGRATARALSKYLSLLLLGLGLIIAAFDGRKQGLHDKIAGTLVLNRKRSDRSATA